MAASTSSPLAGTRVSSASAATSCCSSTGARGSSRIYVSSPRRRASAGAADPGHLVSESAPRRCASKPGERIAPQLNDDCACRGELAQPARSRASRTSCPGSRTTRSCTTCRRAASSNTPAAAGARATSARVRSSCCSRSGRVEPIRDLLLRVMRAAESRRRLAAVVHVLRARARHPCRRLARRHRVLAAAGARAVSDRFRRRERARRARAVLRCACRTRAAPPSGSTRSARSR